ncbi:M13 family peptidase [soil metagenome]
MHLVRMIRSGAALTALAIALPAMAQTSPSTTAPAHAKYGDYGIDPSSMNKTVKPGDDFFSYVNGTWFDTVQIAPDRRSAGFGTKLVDEAEVNVHAIVDDLAKNPAGSPDSQKIGDLYASWMDEAGIEARGTAPLQPYLARIAAVQNTTQLQTLFATIGYASPIDIGITPDFKDPTHYVAASSPGGLGLPSRDYYLLDGEKYVAIRKAYRDYIVQIHALAGLSDGAAKADAIIALETALAKAEWAPEDARDLTTIYNPMTPAELAASAPQYDWAGMMKTMGLTSVSTIINVEPSAATADAKLLDTIPLQTWKDWMTFHFVSDHASYLPKAFDNASFAFFGTMLGGQQQQRLRWKRGMGVVNGALGEAVGKIYVERHYPAESDRQMGELINDLRAAYQERITNAAWMDDATRKEALAKLAAFDPRTGHPVKYIDYSSMVIKRDNVLANSIAAGEFQQQLQLQRLPKPVDRTLWSMTPQTVNAYYNPLSNQITFPAAILQPPFFDPAADAAVNYGAIGAIIGHEMGHGFDDQGSKFDAKGSFRNWWTPETRAAFTKQTAALSAQYDAFEGIPGTHVKGALTLGENIGDLGGIEAAYAAYQRYQSKHGKAKVINGLSGDQRFFIAYAQAWQTKVRDEAMRQQLLADPHSPAKFRVNGVVRNVDAWYTAFNVKPGDALYLAPADRVRIW